MNNDEIKRFLDAEYDRAKKAVEEAKANLERIERTRSSYVAPPGPKKKVRPNRVIPIILADGKKLTRVQFLEALKNAGWSATYEEREFNKLINANIAGAVLAFDGKHYYHPDADERERILRDGRRKKKR